MRREHHPLTSNRNEVLLAPNLSLSQPPFSIAVLPPTFIIRQSTPLKYDQNQVFGLGPQPILNLEIGLKFDQNQN